MSEFSDNLVAWGGERRYNKSVNVILLEPKEDDMRNKRFLVVLLCVAMVFGMMPGMALAGGEARVAAGSVTVFGVSESLSPNTYNIMNCEAVVGKVWISNTSGIATLGVNYSDGKIESALGGEFTTDALVVQPDDNKKIDVFIIYEDEGVKHVNVSRVTGNVSDDKRVFALDTNKQYTVKFKVVDGPRDVISSEAIVGGVVTYNFGANTNAIYEMTSDEGFLISTDKGNMSVLRKVNDNANGEVYLAHHVGVAPGTELAVYPESGDDDAPVMTKFLIYVESSETGVLTVSKMEDEGEEGDFKIGFSEGEAVFDEGADAEIRYTCKLGDFEFEGSEGLAGYIDLEQILFQVIDDESNMGYYSIPIKTDIGESVEFIITASPKSGITIDSDFYNLTKVVKINKVVDPVVPPVVWYPPVIVYDDSDAAEEAAAAEAAKVKAETIAAIKDVKVTWEALRSSKTTALVCWEPEKGADGYVLYRSDSKNGRFAPIRYIKGGDKVKYRNTKLKSKTRYFYKMRPYKVAGDKKVYGAYSSVKKIKTK